MPAFDVNALIHLGRVTAFDVSPDARWIAVAVQQADGDQGTYRSELWRVGVDGTAAERIAAATSDDSAPCFRADGALGFLSDRDPDDPDTRPKEGARRQVWILDPAGTVAPLTDEPLGVTAFRFGADRLVVVTPVWPGIPHADQRAAADARKERGPQVIHYRRMPVRHWDHWIGTAAPHFVRYDAHGNDRVDLTPGADRAFRQAEWDLSADGRILVSTREAPGNDRLPARALAVFDLEAGTRRILDDAPDVYHANPRVDATGTVVASSRSTWQVDHTGPRSLWRFPLAAGASAQQRHPGTDLWLVPRSWSGDDLICSADVDGDHALYRVGPEGPPDRITEAGTYGAVSGGFALREGTTTPPEVVALDGRPLATLSGAPDLGSHVTVSVHETIASDGARIPWRLVRPADADGPLPTLLWIHGGPISQWGDQWHWRWSPLVLAAAGWQVVLPNPRGSTGLGQDHVEGIWGNTWGDRCYRDLMEVTDALVADPRVDADRIVAMGGSFGGYMTNWIGTQTDRFRALVTHASLFSFGAFHRTTDLPAYWTHMFGGEAAVADRSSFERYSPDRHVSEWRSPTLILHGEKDYRVPISEALILFEHLDAQGVHVELVVFPGENHWIVRPPNVIAWYDHVIRFLSDQAS